MNFNQTKLSRKVDLHPATIKYLGLGHFWVTEDSFTKKFPKDQFFLIGVDSKSKKEAGLFIQDSEHRNVKARLFSKNIDINFEEEIDQRINIAIKKRADANFLKERENILLINAEADELPGLMVLFLKDQILIQYYALFWKKIEDLILGKLKKTVAQYYPQIVIKDYWIQERTFDQKKSIRSILNSPLPDFTLNEFGINYNMRINANYDYGLYTDMSSIRKQLLPYIKNKKNVLNLFCYTGAYSLFALKNGALKVTSVDLSSKYLAWLEDNIKINLDLNINQHESVNLSVEKALDKFIKEGHKFDFILSDPPSSSSDGQKRENAFTAYEDSLPKLLDLLSPDGSLVVFLNTHQISWNKFEEKCKNIIDQSKYRNLINIGKRFKLNEDYLPLKGFHEGDYLKGFLIEFKNKKET